jgi:hypothetical protein
MSVKIVVESPEPILIMMNGKLYQAEALNNPGCFDCDLEVKNCSDNCCSGESITDPDGKKYTLAEDVFWKLVK